MIAIVTTPPTSEPVSLDEAMIQARIDADLRDEDFHIEMLIQAAREEAE